MSKHLDGPINFGIRKYVRRRKDTILIKGSIPLKIETDSLITSRNFCRVRHREETRKDLYDNEFRVHLNM